jgi:serine/threonine protein kinase
MFQNPPLQVFDSNTSGSQSGTVTMFAPYSGESERIESPAAQPQYFEEKEQEETKLQECKRPYMSGTIGSIKKSGSQGDAYLNYEKRNVVLKNHILSDILKLHKNSKMYNNMNDLAIYINMCKNAKTLNDLNLPNLVKLEKCDYCFDATDLPNSSVYLIQEQAIGPSLNEFIQKNDEEIIHTYIYNILLQITCTIIILYENNLYHNDLHIENIIITNNNENITLEYIMKEGTIVLNDNRYLVKIIDYGMVTEGHPRDAEYNLDIRKTDPLMDITQLLVTTHRALEIYKKEMDIKNINKLLEFMPYYHIGTGRKSIVPRRSGLAKTIYGFVSELYGLYKNQLKYESQSAGTYKMYKKFMKYKLKNKEFA